MFIILFVGAAIVIGIVARKLWLAWKAKYDDKWEDVAEKGSNGRWVGRESNWREEQTK